MQKNVCLCKQSTLRKSKDILEIVKDATQRFFKNHCTTVAAGIAFYSAFSLAPTLVMVLWVIGFFYGVEAARGQLFSRINIFFGNEVAVAVQSIVEHAHKDSSGKIAAVISLILLIIGTSAMFSTLNTALNMIFPISPKHRSSTSSIILILRSRLTSFILVLCIAFLLIISLILETIIYYISGILWPSTIGIFISKIIQIIIGISVLALVFTMLIKILPDKVLYWHDAALGGCISAILFSAGKKLFALYLLHTGTASAFGAAGSLAVLLMWLFYSAIVLLIGAVIVAAKIHHTRLPLS